MVKRVKGKRVKRVNKKPGEKVKGKTSKRINKKVKVSSDVAKHRQSFFSNQPAMPKNTNNTSFSIAPLGSLSPRIWMNLWKISHPFETFPKICLNWWGQASLTRMMQDHFCKLRNKHDNICWYTFIIIIWNKHDNMYCYTCIIIITTGVEWMSKLVEFLPKQSGCNTIIICQMFPHHYHRTPECDIPIDFDKNKYLN